MGTRVVEVRPAGVSSPRGLMLPDSPRLYVARFDDQCVPPGDRHVHHFFELVFIEDGGGPHGVGGRIVQAGPGDLFLIAPGEVHDPSGLKEAREWIVAFGSEALDPGRSDADLFSALPDELLLLSFLKLRALQTGHFQIPVEERPRWVERLTQLERELHDQQLGFIEATRALLILLLTDTARLAAPQLTAYVPATRPLLTNVFRFIDARYRDPISLSDVAEAVGHAPAYLTDLVRRETGRTVLSWIVERRMAEARYLLLETDQSVEQVAAAVGYRHTSHFIRQFDRLHDMTPSVWRRSQRG
jgi:AraC-like DNA-binding protein/mannose-6-phosphate isomerase-like protein (cupin superfamily)